MQVDPAIEGDHYHLMNAEHFADAVQSESFINRKHIIVLKDPKNLEGFRYNVTDADLEDSVVVNRLLTDKGQVDCRRYNENWEDLIKTVSGDHVEQLFNRKAGLHWNVIDADARLTEVTCFFIPTAIKEVSVNEAYKSALTQETYEAADKIAHYLLVSQPGAVTMWHQDFSATSVFYFLLKGCKIFYFVRPSPNNTRLWKGYCQQPRRDLFFGNHPHLDAGGCVRLVLTERQAVCMPAGYIHCVETCGLSVAFG